MNVVIDRLHKNESIVVDRSYCDSCEKKLNWYDMIPVLSFFLLRGKCRFCKSSLSFYYPAVELITAILFVTISFFVIGGEQFLIFNFQLNPNSLIFNHYFLISLIYYLFIVSSLVVIFFSDLKYGIIPDKIVFSAVLVSLLYFFIYHLSFIIYFVSAVGAFLFFLFLYLITRGRGMGFGDVKLSFLMGLFLGFPKIITAFYIAFLTGAIVSLILVLWEKKKFREGTIPFGPFLVFGTLLGLLLGDKIGITGYINRLMALL